MSNHSDFTHLPAAANPSQPASMASFIWMTVLTMAAIGGTFALSCVTPFAALAVALGGTVGLRASLRIVTVVWFANQLVGFVFFHFPHTVNTFLWGVASGGAALVATIVAPLVMKYGSCWLAPLRLAIALFLSFGVYEMALFAAAVFLGGWETFRPAIVAQLAFINALSLVAIVVLNEVAAALCRSWIGKMPRLVRSS